ncbi:MAG: PHP-associated domain-containing protein, partial [Candidatus Hydrogenedentota bacterium]
LAITCHGAVAHTPYLQRFAQDREVLLLPGIEAFIEGKHVLILNPDEEQAKAGTFAELRRLGRRDAVVIAPHPFFPAKSSLMGELERNIDCFDAIEYSSFHTGWLDLNRKAEAVARKHGLPMVGATDTHVLPYVDSTFTWVDAEWDVLSVIDAIRDGRVRVESRPRPWAAIAATLRFSVEQEIRDRRKPRLGAIRGAVVRPM